MHYFQFNIGEYASHTRHLSPIEDIAYRRLLDLAYTTELPLDKDVRTLSRLVNLREYQQEIIDVLNEFFFEVEDGWINNRVCKEIEKTGRKSEAARNSVAIRWANERKANEIRTQCEDHTNGIREEYERNTNVSENNTNDTENDTTHNPIPITHNQNNKVKSLVAPKPRPSRKAPPDFVVTPEMDSWAERNGISATAVRRETEAFLDHTFATGKTDWLGTWRNWLRRSSRDTRPPEKRPTLGLADQVMQNHHQNQQRKLVCLP